MSVVVSAALFSCPSIAAAQGFGVGARMAWVTADSDLDVDSVRFIGGQIRILSKRWGLEVAMDHNSESFELLNQKVTETPIQASLLLRMGSAKVSPFLLGGPGWYRRKVELLDGPDGSDVTATEFGWHAGGGLEVLALAPLRDPRRLSLHLPRLRPQRRWRRIHRRPDTGAPGIDVDARGHDLLLASARATTQSSESDHDGRDLRLPAPPAR